jgi:hypothetical protein
MRPHFLLVLLVAALHLRSFAEETAPPRFSWSGPATNRFGAVIATIRVDTTETPDLADWGRHAGELCAQWYGRIAEMLPSEGFTPTAKVTLVFRDKMGGVAGTSRDRIAISARYVRGHTDDFGMVIHELTHVVQAYPPGGPGWLVDGIADYIRIVRFEPRARRPRIDPDKANYTDAYKTTAVFLEWLEKEHHPALVQKLNDALRQGRYQDGLFRELLGKDVGELWADFTATLRNR